MVSYASQHWGDHARLAFEVEHVPDLYAAILQFFQSEHNFYYSTWILLSGAYMGDNLLSMSNIHVLAGFGIGKEALRTLDEMQVDVRDSAGRTPLHVACSAGHLSVVKILLERGADKNALDRCGESPISVAVGKGRQAVVEFLLEIGVDMTQDKVFPVAIRCNQDSIIQMLLQKATNMAGIQQSLRDVAAGNKESVVRTIVRAILVSCCCVPQTLLDTCEHTNIISSALVVHANDPTSTSRYKIVEFLLEKGADPNYVDTERPSRNLSVPLACAAGSLEVVKLLVEKGASVRRRGYLGSTPLHSSVLCCETAQFFISKGLDVNSCDDSRRTPLHDVFHKFGAQDARDALCEVLLQEGAYVNTQDDAGVTPLMEVLKAGSHHPLTEVAISRIVRLRKAGAEANLRDHAGFTVLHHATFLGNLPICKILLQHGDTADDQGFILPMAQLYQSLERYSEQCLSAVMRPPLDPDLRARHEQETRMLLGLIGHSRLQANKDFLRLGPPCFSWFTHVVEAFLMAGADLQVQGTFALQVTLSVHPFLWMNGMNDPQTEAIETIECLLRYKLPINTMTRKGTALCIAAQYHWTAMVGLLLEQGANVEIGGDYGSPLMVAACSSPSSDEPTMERTLTLLLDHGADINKAWDSPVTTVKWHYHSYGVLPSGMTALHMCAASSHPASTARLLIDCHANMEALNDWGETPLTLAVRYGRLEMVKALLDAGADPTGPSSLKQHDRFSHAYEVEFRQALHMVQEEDRKRKTSSSAKKKRMRSASPDIAVKTLVRR